MLLLNIYLCYNDITSLKGTDVVFPSDYHCSPSVSCTKRPTNTALALAVLMGGNKVLFEVKTLETRRHSVERIHSPCQKVPLSP